MEYFHKEDLDENFENSQETETTYILGEENEEVAYQIMEDMLANAENNNNFYHIMMLQSITEGDKRLLGEIIQDNTRHQAVLKEMYTKCPHPSRFTSNLYTLDTPDVTYTKNLETAIQTKLENLNRYDHMRCLNKDNQDEAKLQELLLKELSNIQKLNFIYLQNKK